MSRTPVLVVGGGPIGLAVAGDLGWRGIDCTLIEKSDGAVGQPKMDLIGVRTMEFCRRWGLVEAVENSGYQRDHPQDCAWVTSMTGFELGREPFPAPQDEAYPVQSAQKRDRSPQNFFDPVLGRWAKSFPQVTARYNVELLRFEETHSGVVATVKDAKAGREESIECE